MHRWLLIASALLAMPAACSFFVDSELGTVRCDAEGAYGPPACPDGHACLSGLCSPADKPDPGLGTPCGRDQDCAPGDMCLDAARFGVPGPASCSRTCCTSSDCDSLDPLADAAPARAFVCWVPAIGGGAFCRDAQLHGRASPGELAAGEVCEDAAECRSGQCEAGRCADACCTDASCAMTGALCRMSDASENANGAAWSCRGGPAAPKGYLEPCTKDAECASGLCVKLADELRCTQPCCDSASCGMIETMEVSAKIACAHLPRHGSFVRACAAVLVDGGELAVGAPCKKGVECRSGTCAESPMDPGHGTCSDVCCVDADCGSPSISCRPVPHGDAWALRCVPGNTK